MPDKILKLSLQHHNLALEQILWVILIKQVLSNLFVAHLGGHHHEKSKVIAINKS
jgi:hypothetical protein